MVETPKQRWKRRIGQALAWLLPPAGLAAASLSLSRLDAFLQYLLAFILALALAKAGRLVASPQWGLDGPVLVSDLAVAVAMGLAAYVGSRLALGSGGGVVDPALVAVVGAYVINLWPVA